MIAQARGSFRAIGLAGFAAVCVAMMALPAAARAEDAAIVSNVKVLSDKNPDDVSSAEAWKKCYIKDGMSDQEKAIAIWKTVVKYRHQESPPGEGLTSCVHEPFKTFNVYGYGMCCCAASNIEGLARAIGMPARGRIIVAHSVPEVWYDGAWHLLDASLMFYLTKPDGQIAGVDDMKADIVAWRRQHPEIKTENDLKNFAKDDGWKNGPPLFATCKFYDKNGINRAGWHGWWSNIVEYNYKVGGKGWKYVVPPDTKGTVNVFDYGAIMGYQVNVQLREGEKLTRRWYATQVATGLDRGNKKQFEKFLLGDMSALGQQKEFGDLSPGRIGNGTLEYDAMADSRLASDAIACENLKVEGGRVRLAEPSKPATLIIRMPCSYLYLNGEMTCAPVVGEGGEIAAAISLNNGLDWKELAKFDKSGQQKTDLKAHVFNKYDYRIKFEFNGAGSGLDALKLTHDIQHSQAPLPIITEGDNKITFTAGPQEGTITVQGNMDDSAKDTMRIRDFHPMLEGAAMDRFRIGTTAEADEKAPEMDDLTKAVADPPNHGAAIVPVTTPGDITRIRLSVHWRARNSADGYVVSASFDKGKTWKEMCKLDLAHPAKSGYLTFADVPAGERNVQVKFDGTQSCATEIFDLRIDVDYKEPSGGFRPVKVTYTWEEGGPANAPAASPSPTTGPADKRGTLKTDEHICTTARDTWTIRCGPGTVAKSYTVELAK
ncbi:MAG: hypothetical protein ACE15C_11520 [Phycisphaerae bacterium]